jgi:hypothetical protein
MTGHAFPSHEEEAFMPTSLEHCAVYLPATLKRAAEAFDGAWRCVAKDFEPAARPAAQLKLANIILELAPVGDSNPLELKCRAIGAMQAPDVGEPTRSAPPVALF